MKLFIISNNKKFVLDMLDYKSIIISYYALRKMINISCYFEIQVSPLSVLKYRIYSSDIKTLNTYLNEINFILKRVSELKKEIKITIKCEEDSLRAIRFIEFIRKFNWVHNYILIARYKRKESWDVIIDIINFNIN